MIELSPKDNEKTCNYSSSPFYSPIYYIYPHLICAVQQYLYVLKDTYSHSICEYAGFDFTS